jgi:hypothetical protein
VASRAAPLETLELQHQERNHQEQHERKDREDTRLRLGALLHGPARHHVVARGKFRLERGNLGGERFHDGCRLYAWNGIGLDSDGRQPLPAPDQRRFEAIPELRHLLERHGLSARGLDHEAPQSLERGTLIGNGARDKGHVGNRQGMRRR